MQAAVGAHAVEALYAARVCAAAGLSGAQRA
jgi:hypothetical protein